MEYSSIYLIIVGHLLLAPLLADLEPARDEVERGDGRVGG